MQYFLWVYTEVSHDWNPILLLLGFYYIDSIVLEKKRIIVWPLFLTSFYSSKKLEILKSLCYTGSILICVWLYCTQG